MIKYMSLEEQVDKEFLRARHRAFFRRLAARLRGVPEQGALPAFDEARKAMHADNRLYLGRRVVEVSKIVGSVGRYRHFDRGFMPTKSSMAEKWKRVDRAFHRGMELPPVRLYKLGDLYFVEDGNHRVSVARYQGVEWIEAEVTEFHAPSLLEPTRAGTAEETMEHTRSEEIMRRRFSKMHETNDPEEREEKIRVRWGSEQDETSIAELMELNGLCRALAFEEQFIVAEKDGKVLAALRYRTEPKRLLLGLLVSDPWAEERPLAVALYEEAGKLAREMGCTEVRACSVVHANDYPHEAGYRWRFLGGWYLDVTQLLHRRTELPQGGWRKVVALLGVPAVPFFRAFRGVSLRWASSDGRGRNHEVVRSGAERGALRAHADELAGRIGETRDDGPGDLEGASRRADA